LVRKTRWPVGVCRVLVDATTVAAGYLLGGQVGIGTIVAAFGFGTLLNLTFHAVGFRAEAVRQENLPETLRRLRGNA
ncbi:MAG: hypothetical protein IKN53_07320, partial [Oscillibacter sp.]|nr:hypothetical protein [Oscillibacter sp.]